MQHICNMKDFANAGCAADQQEAQEERLKSTFALVCNNSDTDDQYSYVDSENEGSLVVLQE